MKAVAAVRLGGPEVLEIVDLPMPDLAPGEVLVRVDAVAVNPTDTLIRSGAPLVHERQPDSPPWVPGMDLAGVVARVGEAVGSRLKEGDRVVAIVTPRGTHGAYAQYVAVPAESVVAAPRGIEATAAATLLMNAMTARLALDVLELSRGELVLVTGAAGTLGGYVLQLANHDGLVALADAAEADVDLVRSLGAHEAHPRGPGLGDRIRRAHPAGVAGVVDAAVLNEEVVPALAPAGRLATVREWQGPGGGVDVRKVRVREAARDTSALEDLVRLVEDGALTLRVAKVFAADRASEAHQMLEAGGVRGRIVLDLRSIG